MVAQSEDKDRFGSRQPVGGVFYLAPTHLDLRFPGGKADGVVDGVEHLLPLIERLELLLQRLEALQRRHPCQISAEGCGVHHDALRQVVVGRTGHRTCQFT